MRRLMFCIFGLVVAIGTWLVADYAPTSRFATGIWFVTDLPIIIAGFIYAGYDWDSELKGIMGFVFGGATGVCLTIASGSKYTPLDGQWWIAYLIIMMAGNIYALIPQDVTQHSEAESKPENNKMIEPA